MRSRNLLLTVLGSLLFIANTVPSAAATNYKLSVSVAGLNGTLVVEDNKTDTLTFTTNDTQSFARTYASGATYTVRIKTQPSGQTCTLSSNATGTMTANTTVTATCTSAANYTISVAVSGLTSGSLVMQDNNNDLLTFTTNATQTFAKTYASGASLYRPRQDAAFWTDLHAQHQCKGKYHFEHHGHCDLRCEYHKLQDQCCRHRPHIRNAGSARQQIRHTDIYQQYDPDLRLDLCERLHVLSHSHDSADRSDLHAEQQLQRNDHRQHHGHRNLHR